MLDKFKRMKQLLLQLVVQHMQYICSLVLCLLCSCLVLHMQHLTLLVVHLILRGAQQILIFPKKEVLFPS